MNDNDAMPERADKAELHQIEYARLGSAEITPSQLVDPFPQTIAPIVCAVVAFPVAFIPFVGFILLWPAISIVGTILSILSIRSAVKAKLSGGWFFARMSSLLANVGILSAWFYLLQFYVLC
jgi:hypothetical protein